MEAIETLKERVEFLSSVGERSSDIVIRKEYVIPDTHPDVDKILFTDVRTNILNKEVLHNKVLLNGDIEFMILYKSKEDNESTLHSLNYRDKFSGGVDISGESSEDLVIEASSYLEHVDANTLNERKVSINGVVKLISKLNKRYSYEIIKDVEYEEEIETLKSPRKINKILDIINESIQIENSFIISNSMPEVDEILKYDINVRHKEVKLYDDRIEVNMNMILKMLYKNKESGELHAIEEDLYLEKEIEKRDIEGDAKFEIDNTFRNLDIFVNENELGEKKVIELSGSADVVLKASREENFDLIEDVYSTKKHLKVIKNEFELSDINRSEDEVFTVRESIEIPRENPKPSQVIMSTGEVFVVDKKNLEDKVTVEGIVRVSVIYKTDNPHERYSSISEEIPFSETLDVSGSRIDMNSNIKANIQDINGIVEGNNIGVSAVINCEILISKLQRSNFIIDIIEDDEFTPGKKYSITIYIVKEGDTLWKIAKKYSTSINSIVMLNGIDESEDIYPGQKLLIPGTMQIN